MLGAKRFAVGKRERERERGRLIEVGHGDKVTVVGTTGKVCICLAAGKLAWQLAN